MTKAFDSVAGNGTQNSTENVSSSFENFQTAASTYRRTRLMQSMIDMDIEEMRDMVKMYADFKEKVFPFHLLMECSIIPMSEGKACEQ